MLNISEVFLLTVLISTGIFFLSGRNVKKGKEFYMSGGILFPRPFLYPESWIKYIILFSVLEALLIFIFFSGKSVYTLLSVLVILASII